MYIRTCAHIYTRQSKRDLHQNFTLHGSRFHWLEHKNKIQKILFLIVSGLMPFLTSKMLY